MNILIYKYRIDQSIRLCRNYSLFSLKFDINWNFFSQNILQHSHSHGNHSHSHSRGNLLFIPISMRIPWDSHSHREFHSLCALQIHILLTYFHLSNRQNNDKKPVLNSGSSSYMSLGKRAGLIFCIATMLPWPLNCKPFQSPLDRLHVVVPVSCSVETHLEKYIFTDHATLASVKHFQLYCIRQRRRQHKTCIDSIEEDSEQIDLSVSEATTEGKSKSGSYTAPFRSQASERFLRATAVPAGTAAESAY